MRHDPTARFVLSAGDISDTFYQPAEGGRRALTDGPLRHDSNGMRRTTRHSMRPLQRSVRLRTKHEHRLCQRGRQAP